MNFKNYCKTYFTDIISNHFFDFKGRTNRKVFWLFSLNVLILNLILSYIIHKFDFIGIIAGIVFSLFMFFPTLSLDVRRLHDVGFSGWWVLIFFIPLFGFIALIVFACIPGTQGENKYGPVPADTNITE